MTDLSAIERESREQYEHVVAALAEAVVALDLVIEVIQAEGKLRLRAILSDKLLTATRELRATVAALAEEADRG